METVTMIISIAALIISVIALIKVIRDRDQ